MLWPFGIGIMSPWRKEDGMCPDWSIELKMVARITGRVGPAYIRCSLTKLFGPAAFLRGRHSMIAAISSLVTRSGDVLEVLEDCRRS